MTATDPIHVTYSLAVPEAWHVLVDSHARTVAIVMMAPYYRCIFGNPLDAAITELRISPAAMIRQARLAALESWMPHGAPH